MLKSLDFMRDLFNLFFPVNCPGCNMNFVTAKEPICLSCRADLPMCRFASWEGNPMEVMLEGRLPFKACCALAYFEKKGLMQNLVHHLKYKGMKELGFLFADLLAGEIIRSQRFEGLDCIVAVPLHPSKLRKRGYNQVSTFAERLSFHLGLPLCNENLKRHWSKGTQTVKDRSQRTELLHGNFYIDGKMGLSGKHVLLVDDVVTTGATLEACASAMRDAEGLHLSVATMAFAR